MAKTRYPQDDITLLLPRWRVVVQKVMDDLRALGFKPVLFDGLRTDEEALRNARRGVGIIDSVHLYGAAADIICDDHGWSCKAKGCKMYTKLGQIAESHGCTWGGRFKRVDLPHIQAVPVAAQKELRELGRKAESIEARDALIRRYV